MLYWPIAQKAINHGMYVVMRPPGVCPKELKVGDYYQDYLKTVWNIVSSNSTIKANAGVVSIELANEPVHIKNQYGQTSATAMRDYFQPIIDIIRRNGFTGIIWVPGMGYSSGVIISDLFSRNSISWIHSRSRIISCFRSCFRV